jgi:hypothetical protein
MLMECDLEEMCTLKVFNIFDIGNTGTVDPKEFLLTMLAFRPEPVPLPDGMAVDSIEEAARL